MGYIQYMGVGSGGKEGAVPSLPPWIFIHGTDIVDTSLTVVFFGLFLLFFDLFFPLSPWKLKCSAGARVFKVEGLNLK